MNIKVMTTDMSISDWQTLEHKKYRAESLLDSMFGISSRVDLEFHDLKPKVKDGKIEHRWLGVIVPDEKDKKYTHVAFHFTTKRAAELSLGGYVDIYEDIPVGVLVMDETDDVVIEDKLLLLLQS